MPSKPSSPGPSTTPATPAKQTRSRKSTIPNQTEQERAGSAGGVILPKETAAKASPSSAKKAAATAPGPDDASVTEVKTPKRKPRKLNKDPATNPADTTKSPISNEITSNSELEALKSRVKGLEAKVEELYKSGAILDSRGGRSPRRRGKGRKGSSTTQVPQVNTTDSDVGATSARVQELDDDLDADEELVRLEGELEVARQDLEHYRPRARRSRSDETEFVEEIPRGGTADRQVTLSGSYRIPIPASVNLQDVQTIKSGVSAAQNVARSFLEQRRASAAAARAQSATQDAPPPTTRSSTTNVPTSKTRPKRSMSSNMEVSVDNSSGKQSWSDWIGGYSMAISRAVSKIEHEAAIEAQRSSAAATGGSGRKTSAPTSKKTAGKRPAAKATLSGEQVHGLMS